MVRPSSLEESPSPCPLPVPSSSAELPKTVEKERSATVFRPYNLFVFKAVHDPVPGQDSLEDPKHLVTIKVPLSATTGKRTSSQAGFVSEIEIAGVGIRKHPPQVRSKS